MKSAARKRTTGCSEPSDSTKRLAKAIDMATANPMKLFPRGRRDRGRLKAGFLADFLLFDTGEAHRRLELREVWRRGERIK